MPPAPSLTVLLGTYTPAGGDSRGIYAARLDPATGAWGEPTLAAAISNPTFLAWLPGQRGLVALTEQGIVNGKPGGALAAFRFDPANAGLTPLNVEPTGGGPLAHVSVDQTGRVATVVSYHRGEIASFPLRSDGTVGPRATLLTLSGDLGPNRQRQERAHPHSTSFSPDNRFAYLCDLGLDRVFHFSFDPASAQLSAAGETATAPGAGPRHSAFSGGGRFLHVINELDSTIATYAVEPADGRLTATQAVSTLPAGFTGENICAEIRVSADGRFVYGSNRGHDSLAVFARDVATGALQPVEIVPCGGRHPRNFNLSPDGRWLVCANRDSNNVTAFRVDATTGRLTPAGPGITVPQAVCVLFTPVS